MPDAELRTICIVGAGPRGTYAFRRLALSLERCPLSVPVRIHLIEKSGHFGGGQVHDPSQPHYLLLNTVCSQVTAFGDDDEAAREEPSRRSLHGYLASRGLSMEPNDYPPRALHGEYLAAMSQWTESVLPDSISVERHPEAVIDMERHGDQVLLRLDSGREVLADQVLLATGHSRNKIRPDTLEDVCADFARDMREKGENISYTHYAYPIEANLEHVTAEDTVYVIGMGLTAIDVVKGLTLGRAGRFEGDRYLASGEEPHIILGSRLGAPAAARGHNQRLKPHQARIFTPEAVAEMRGKGRLDFSSDIFPLIEWEMEYVYYSTLLGPEFGEQLAGTPEPEERAQLISAAVEPPERFSWQLLENPFLSWPKQTMDGFPKFSSLSEYRDAVLEIMDQDMAEADKGNRFSPIKSSIDAVLRDCRDTLRMAVRHSGLTPTGHRYLTGPFSRTNNRVAVGPPLSSVRELAALLRQGVVSFSGPVPKLNADTGERVFFLESPMVENSRRMVQHVVNGRIHGVAVQVDDSPLVARLLAKGWVRPYVNEWQGDVYTPGGLDVDEQFRVIGRDGKPNSRVSAVGIPVEGRHWFNAVDARPDVNSTAMTQIAAWAEGAVSALHDV
ncbi:MAG: hypothetical protein D6E12_07875 [Desulfovibrio sp.]|nr:MAG: hypothetical protein D6E12_07875 [Desulfovibrio sp.]